MRQIFSISDMRDYIDAVKGGRTIGFVPTMGYLHEGHISLVESSVSENDITIVSIFVNPTQFGENEDFAVYPRDLERDLSMLTESKVDVVFLPSGEEIFPDGFSTWIVVDGISEKFCGRARPGHFRGVATIVQKLINLVSPDRLYLGEKDFQQVYVVQKMLKDLNIFTEVIMCPTVREHDSLAMSSRNAYLSVQERERATCLSKSIILARDFIDRGIVSADILIDEMTKLIHRASGDIDYIAFIDENTFEEQTVVSSDTRVLMAVKIGNTRLIDNFKIGDRG
jgi:pantoate--beta-alanine ligase